MLEQGTFERQGDPRAVTRFAVGTKGSAVAKRAQTGQRQGQDPVTPTSTGIGHEPHAAGIVLVARVVQRTGRTEVAEALGWLHWLLRGE